MAPAHKVSASEGNDELNICSTLPVWRSAFHDCDRAPRALSEQRVNFTLTYSSCGFSLQLADLFAPGLWQHVIQDDLMVVREQRGRRGREHSPTIPFKKAPHGPEGQASNTWASGDVPDPNHSSRHLWAVLQPVIRGDSPCPCKHM
jgi:hypothetical protein